MQLQQGQKNTQQLRPQMLSAARILHMDAAELGGYLLALQLENPMLEYCPAEDLIEQPPEPDDGYDRADAGQSGAPHDDGAPYAGVPDRAHAAYGEDLTTHLRFQLDRMRLDARVYRRAVSLILQLDDAGYLRTPLEALGPPEDAPLWREALCIVQSLDPAGVGARDLSECLCLQLHARGETGPACAIAAGFLSEMGKRMYATIATRLDVSEAQTRAACDLIRSLSPAPGARFASPENADYLVPDLLVRRHDGALFAELNRARQPTATLSPFYSRLVRETADPAVRQYLTQKQSQATWTLACIAQREATVLRCANEILKRQRAFFTGDGPLAAMTMEDLSAALGIHVSTVSRALHGKTIQTPHGVRALGTLFPAALDASAGVSADHARRSIAALIAQEDAAAPLSDAKLSELLTARGIPVSRRTVAKYRQALHIPAAIYRRR